MQLYSQLGHFLLLLVFRGIFRNCLLTSIVILRPQKFVSFKLISPLFHAGFNIQFCIFYGLQKRQGGRSESPCKSLWLQRDDRVLISSFRFAFFCLAVVSAFYIVIGSFNGLVTFIGKLSLRTFPFKNKTVNHSRSFSILLSLPCCFRIVHHQVS
jgi:hypothetical protein